MRGTEQGEVPAVACQPRVAPRHASTLHSWAGLATQSLAPAGHQARFPYPAECDLGSSFCSPQSWVRKLRCFDIDSPPHPCVCVCMLGDVTDLLGKPRGEDQIIEQPRAEGIYSDIWGGLAQLTKSAHLGIG